MASYTEVCWNLKNLTWMTEIGCTFRQLLRYCCAIRTRIWILKGRRPSELHSVMWQFRRFSGWLPHTWGIAMISSMVCFTTPQRQKKIQIKNISQGKQSDEGEWVRFLIVFVVIFLFICLTFFLFSYSVCCYIFVYLFIIYLILLIYYAVLWFVNKFIALFL